MRFDLEMMTPLVIAGLLLVITATVVFCWPTLLLVFPIVLGFAVQHFRNQPCHPENVKTFFNGFKIGGHRGSPFAFPENSIAGFEQAKLEGADLIEFDIALTKDGVAVLMHDDDLDRTTNLTGPIRDRTLKELRSANIAAKFTRTVPDVVKAVEKESVPVLEDVVRWAVENNMNMLFDVKDYDTQLVQIIAELFERYQLYGKAIVCSFFPQVVYRIKQGNQKILTGLTWRQKFFSHHDIGNKMPRYSGLKHWLALILDSIHVALLRTISPWFLGADLLLTNNLDVSQSLVNEQRAWGRHVAVWTVNDIGEMHWMTETLQIPVLTDYPCYIKNARHLQNMRTKAYDHGNF